MMSLSSFTINVNLGKLNEANDNATMKISPSNEETSALTRSRREEMKQKLYLQEKGEINQLPKEDLHCLKFGMLFTKTSIITWITCKNKMK